MPEKKKEVSVNISESPDKTLLGAILIYANTKTGQPIIRIDPTPTLALSGRGKRMIEAVTGALKAWGESEGNLLEKEKADEKV